MSLIASAQGGSTFENCPEGVHIARCYRIIDLGSQHDPKFNKTKRKILIQWETPNSLTSEGKPHMISKKYSLTLSDKAILRLDLQAWRGRAFTAAELEGFDIANLLGKVCMMNIMHTERDGKTYANIASIMPLPGGSVAPPAVNKPVLFSLSNFDAGVFDQLSNGIKQIIMASPEYNDVASSASSYTSGQAQDDDIPF